MGAPSTGPLILAEVCVWGMGVLSSPSAAHFIGDGAMNRCLETLIARLLNEMLFLARASL